jgi:hypothetical protein
MHVWPARRQCDACREAGPAEGKEQAGHQGRRDHVGEEYAYHDTRNRRRPDEEQWQPAGARPKEDDVHWCECPGNEYEDADVVKLLQNIAAAARRK